VTSIFLAIWILDLWSVLLWSKLLQRRRCQQTCRAQELLFRSRPRHAYTAANRVWMRELLLRRVGINRRLLLGSTVGFCWDRPSALAGIDRRLLPGSTASCKVSSANENCTRRFGAAERRTFLVFLIAI
jgi:hypothetical protein